MANAKVITAETALARLRIEFGEGEVKAGLVWKALEKMGVKPRLVVTPERQTRRGYVYLGEAAAIFASRSPVVSKAPKAPNVPSGVPHPLALKPTANVVHSNSDMEMSVNNVVAMPMVPRTLVQNLTDLIPDVDPTYVPFGHYADVESIIKSKVFFPMFVTGLSGNGKTLMAQQICAKLKRPCIRVNITEETDEDALIGGSTLVNGNIVEREGPVLTAMRLGCLLIVDEIDLGHENKIMCLQSIMEGQPYFNKKTGEKIYPQPGFNIVGTANTKGRGSDTGRFSGTHILNEAMLDRFAVWFEQEYPSAAVEKKILNANFKQLGIANDDTARFAENLSRWADVIRKAYVEGATEEMISTRRVVSICRAFSIFKSRSKAITVALARFDANTKEAFFDLYTKVDAELENELKQPSADNSTLAGEGAAY